MESLSSTHEESWSTDQQDLFRIPRTKVKTSDYETGLSAAEYDEEDKPEERSNKVAGKAIKVRLEETCM